MPDHHLYGPSSLRRRQLCPGSARMERGLPEKTSADSDEGTRLHAVMAGTDHGEWMDAEQRECVEWCKERNASDSDDWHREQLLCLWAGRESYREVTYGTADAFRAVWPDRAVVVDYKFGRGYVPAVRDNIQMAAYAAMVMQHTGAKSCEAHILQPRLRRHDSFVFTNCAGIVATIEGIIAACEAPDAPLVAGAEQCRYCRAFANCPAASGTMYSVAARIPNSLAECNPDELAAMWQKWQVAKRFGAEVEDRINAICQEQGNCANLVLQSRAGLRTVTDPQKAFEAVAEMLAAPEFLKCCSVSVSQLESAYIEKTAERTETGRKKAGEERAKKAEFAELLAGLIEQGAPSVSLVERKETEQ